MKQEVVYDMPEEDYRAVNALSYSAIKDINISINDYFYNRDNPKETIGKTIGKAYHRAIIDGFDVFYEQFKPPFNGENCLKSKQDLIDFCINNQIDFKESWTKDKIFDVIKSCGHSAQSYDDAKKKYETDATIIPQDSFDRIKAYSDIINKNDISKALSDAHKEVSVFWKEDGINCKARFDALIPQGVFDLKTFDNSRGLNIDKAVNMTIVNYQYDIQAYFYTKAYKAMHALKINGFENPDPSFFMIFLQTNGGLNIRTRILHSLNDSETIINAYWERASEKIENAKKLYKKHVMKKEDIRYDFFFDELQDKDLPSYYFKD